MAGKPRSAVPRPVLLMLALALAGQLLWQAARPAPRAAVRPLPAAPALATLRLASLGEPVVLSKLMMLYLQAEDDQPGVRLGLRQLDYVHLRGWLARLLELDPRAQYPLLAASQVYAAVDDPARVRLMLDFVYTSFQADPQRRWPWLAHAVLAAKHRLRDLPLARRYAQALRQQATGPEVPAWALEMELFILQDMNELDSARALAGAMLHDGGITDPHELQFLSGQLERIATRPRAPIYNGH